ncbi:sugar ABC transporter permease [Subtercola boreus]|uniref:Sugar ABC transporter permease n=1 Tax=Subtercola boreus TaxID=120213 RepID=A0A3E0VE76_9MICO|nr:carbohydrate ABC transporter permease [Subtercola boreus]RFA08224.1 sugar ABC transporter permease [Subtercola boreus]TQL54882.1 multiple sugar transport system permease protein [Subtercola boreus]
MTVALSPVQPSATAPVPGRPPVPPRKRSKTGAAPRKSTFITVVMLAAAAYFLLPIAWLVIASTKTNSGLFRSFGFAFDRDFALFSNIADVFTRDNGIFVRWLLNTVVYASVSAVGATLLATLAGYAFAKYQFPGGRLLFSVILGAIMIPSTALAIPTYLLFSGAGLTDTPLAVILPSIVNPFGLYLMMVYAQGAIDTSLLEAGRIDGAGEFRIFWQLCLRVLAPGMVTVLLFSLVATWNNYFLPLIMLNTSDLLPLTVGLAQWQSAASRGNGGEALFSAVISGSLVSTIPLVIAFLFLQKYWQSGLTAGGVKG